MTVLYSAPGAPSPRRARIFLAEKGIEVPVQNVDLRNGEQFADEFRRRNRCCTVPVLELDDGTCIAESDAICLYFETLHPEPALMGTDARSRALVRSWDRWAEMDGYLAVAEGFRNSFPGFKDRAVPGPHPVAQIEALADRGVQRYRYFLEDLDARLAETPYVALETFSVADITAMVTVDFARRALEIEPGDNLTHLHRWYAEVSARPSAQA